MKEKPKSSKSPKNNKRKEQLTTRDIEELMGVHRDTYERRRGAVRRK